MSLIDLTRTIAPAQALLTLAASKTHMRVETPDYDERITALIDGVSDFLEGYDGYMGRALVNQTWALRLDAFPSGDCIDLPLPDLVSAVVTYLDANGATQTLSASAYHVLDGRVSRLMLKDGQSWPSTATHPRAVTVTFVCGFGATNASVPKAIIAAAQRMVQIQFDRMPGDEIAMEAAVLSVAGQLAMHRRLPVA